MFIGGIALHMEFGGLAGINYLLCGQRSDISEEIEGSVGLYVLFVCITFVCP